MDINTLSSTIATALQTARSTSGDFTISTSSIETASGLEVGTISAYWPDLITTQAIRDAMGAGSWSFHHSGARSRFVRSYQS